MPEKHYPKSIFIRLYGGADDGGILELPVADNHVAIAVALASGHYYSTGLWDPTGKVIFAYPGTEGALLHGYC